MSLRKFIAALIVASSAVAGAGLAAAPSASAFDPTDDETVGFDVIYPDVDVFEDANDPGPIKHNWKRDLPPKSTPKPTQEPKPKPAP